MGCVGSTHNGVGGTGMGQHSAPLLHPPNPTEQQSSSQHRPVVSFDSISPAPRLQFVQKLRALLPRRVAGRRRHRRAQGPPHARVGREVPEGSLRPGREWAAAVAAVAQVGKACVLTVCVQPASAGRARPVRVRGSSQTVEYDFGNLSRRVFPETPGQRGAEGGAP